jgi:hypothetical protein
MTTNQVSGDDVFGHKQQFIKDDIYLRIVRYNNSIAELYFVNGNRIDIPKELLVINEMTRCTIPRYQTFALLWSESYIVTMDINDNGPFIPVRF